MATRSPPLLISRRSPAAATASAGFSGTIAPAADGGALCERASGSCEHNSPIDSAKLRPQVLYCCGIAALAAFSRHCRQCGPPATRNLLIIGDSLSAGYGLDEGRGWVALLAKRLQICRFAIPSSMPRSGDTSAGGLAAAAALARYQPGVLVIEAGGTTARGQTADACTTISPA